MPANIYSVKRPVVLAEFACPQGHWFLLPTPYFGDIQTCPLCGEHAYLNDSDIHVLVMKKLYDKQQKKR